MEVADWRYFAEDIEVVQGLPDQAGANVERLVANGRREEWNNPETAIVQLLDTVVGRQGLEPWTR